MTATADAPRSPCGRPRRYRAPGPGRRAVRGLPGALVRADREPRHDRDAQAPSHQCSPTVPRPSNSEGTGGARRPRQQPVDRLAGRPPAGAASHGSLRSARRSTGCPDRPPMTPLDTSTSGPQQVIEGQHPIAESRSRNPLARLRRGRPPSARSSHRRSRPRPHRSGPAAVPGGRGLPQQQGQPRVAPAATGPARGRTRPRGRERRDPTRRMAPPACGPTGRASASSTMARTRSACCASRGPASVSPALRAVRSRAPCPPSRSREPQLLRHRRRVYPRRVRPFAPMEPAPRTHAGIRSLRYRALLKLSLSPSPKALILTLRPGNPLAPAMYTVSHRQVGRAERAAGGHGGRPRGDLRASLPRWLGFARRERLDPDPQSRGPQARPIPHSCERLEGARAPPGRP